MPSTEPSPPDDHTILPACGGTSEELLPLLYEELRRLARRQVEVDHGALTLSATALVHEAWVKLSKEQNPLWQNQRHFFNAAAQAMRWILIERARKRQSHKRGGRIEHVELEDSQIVAPAPDEELLAINESLSRLAQADPEAAELIQLRYYAGLTWPAMAELTGISERELARQCEYARAWLRADMEAGA